jgi:hypothetical protein
MEIVSCSYVLPPLSALGHTSQKFCHPKHQQKYLPSISRVITAIANSCNFVSSIPAANVNKGTSRKIKAELKTIGSQFPL